MNDWSGATVAILASGPSMTPAIATHAFAKADHVIVINETWRLCRGADVLYAADSAWWKHRAPLVDQFIGQRWTQTIGWHGVAKPDGIHVVEAETDDRIALTGPIGTGGNSTFQALGLAVQWGAKKIVFAGLDLQIACKTHWHGDHEQPLRNTTPATFTAFRKAFINAAPKLQALGVEIINATPASALECFPKMDIEDALP